MAMMRLGLQGIVRLRLQGIVKLQLQGIGRLGLQGIAWAHVCGRDLVFSQRAAHCLAGEQGVDVVQVRRAGC